MECLETWYLKGLADKDNMVVNLLPLVVIKSLDVNGSQQDVNRVYNLRSAFSLMEYNDTDSSTKPFLNLLLKTLQSPGYLKSEEGLKFLTHICTLDKTLLENIVKAMKGQIPKATKAQVREGSGDGGRVRNIPPNHYH